MGLTFNIVYTTGTAKYLLLFVFSLLKWSDASFCLVANACALDEVRLLERLCDTDSRLQFLVAPSPTIMRHGEVLDYLHSLRRADYFCFMDSDIIAFADFVAEMTPYLSEHAAVFSGSPIWCRQEEQTLSETLTSIPGHVHRTANGVCLGSSYFAIYENQVLTEFVASTGIGFGRYAWPVIPAPYQAELVRLGLKRTKYDTGKLLNILLGAQGTPLILLDSGCLYHVGGISAQTARRSGRLLRTKVKPARWVPRGKLRRWIARLGGLTRSQRSDVDAIDEELKGLQIRRRRSAVYFHRLFSSLFESRPLPEIPRMGDPQIEKRLESVTGSLLALHEEFGGQLANLVAG